MVVKNCINIFAVLEVFSRVGSNGMNPSSILQQFNWSHQLIIVFCALLEVPFPLWFRSDPDQVRRARDSFCKT